MAQHYSVTLKKVIEDNAFEILSTPKDTSQIYISCKDVNRPGLILAGTDDYFDSGRVQFIGLSETGYLNGLSRDERSLCLERFISRKPSCIIITRNLAPIEEIVPLAIKYCVPVLRTAESTSDCMAALIAYLGVELAERIVRHGVLVEVSGEGVLIIGNSGVGKSETAVELIKRGHRLIADDAVEIRRVSSRSLVGAAPDNIRHFIEIRGIGIINARNIFGMGAVKLTEKIDMVVRLEPWDEEKVYDRLGIENELISILGIEVPLTTVPVKPGRNLAVIIEVAAMNNREKKLGYNAAHELMQKLGMTEFEDETPHEPEIWH